LCVYQRALILTEQSTCCCSMNEHQSLCTYCAAICYKLALLYHQDGMASGNIQSTTKAEKLHAACIEILGDSEISFLNETTLLIVIAASNNLAGIEFEKGMVYAVTNRLRFLATVLQEFEDANLDVLRVAELRDFLSIIFLGNGLTAAPAA
jgi:hypothetical protein